MDYGYACFAFGETDCIVLSGLHIQRDIWTPTPSLLYEVCTVGVTWPYTPTDYP